jgi:hypothetical protein
MTGISNRSRPGGWASLTPQKGYVVQPVPLTANAVGAALLLV